MRSHQLAPFVKTGARFDDTRYDTTGRFSPFPSLSNCEGCTTFVPLHEEAPIAHNLVPQNQPNPKSKSNIPLPPMKTNFVLGRSYKQTSLVSAGIGLIVSLRLSAHLEMQAWCDGLLGPCISSSRCRAWPDVLCGPRSVCQRR